MSMRSENEDEDEENGDADSSTNTEEEKYCHQLRWTKTWQVQMTTTLVTEHKRSFAFVNLPVTTEQDGQHKQMKIGCSDGADCTTNNQGVECMKGTTMSQAIQLDMSSFPAAN